MIFSPPKKINKKIYRCDKKFHLDDILVMYDNQINYGIALISGNEYRYYLVEITGTHKAYRLLSSDDIELQKKMRRGGMSASRINRHRVLKENHYVRDMAEMLVKTYMKNNNTRCMVDKLIVAGPSDMKNKVIQEDITQQYFSKIITTVTCSVITDNTINEIYYKCQNMFITSDNKESKIIMDEISDLISNNPDKLIFGFDEVLSELKNQNIEKLIIDKDMNNKDKIIKLLNDKIQFIETDKRNLRGFGCAIAIRYFSNNNVGFSEFM